MSGAEVRIPRATAQIQGINARVDTVTTHFGINAFPSVSVSFHGANVPKGVLSPAGSDVANLVASQQNQMFTSQSANSSIFMDDGKDRTLEFNGFISGPNYTLGVGNVGLNTTIVHSASAVSNLKTNIYTNRQGAFRDGSTPMQPEIGIGLWNILTKLRDTKLHTLPDEESKAIVAQVDANNANALEIWNRICTSSEVEWPELETLLEYPQVKTNLLSQIADIYTNPYNDFVQTMQQFQAMFAMIYVPSLEADNPGKFIPASAAVDGDAEDVKLRIRSISMSAGPRNIMPLSYVAVRGPKPQNHRKVQYGHIIRRWPTAPVSTGQVVELGPPNWLPTALVAGRASGDTVGDTLSLAGYKSDRINKDRRLYEVIFPAVGELLDRWAQQHYTDFALANAYAHVITDLDVSAEPGTRYNVSSANGALFTGFLVGVEHSVSSKPQQLQAYTKLTFSHVEANGFTLPFKS